MDQVGVVTDMLERVEFDADDAVAFVCGPEIMMHFTLRELIERGVASDDIYVSMERNMKCAIGLCGHCQLGPLFVCKDGPVFPYSQLKPFFGVREL